MNTLKTVDEMVVVGVANTIWKEVSRKVPFGFIFTELMYSTVIKIAHDRAVIIGDGFLKHVLK